MQEGYVYLARAENGLIKIGCSWSPGERLCGLRVKQSGPVTLIHQISSNDMRWAERYLHFRFAARRSSGEWFALDANDLVELQAVSRLDRDPREGEVSRPPSEFPVGKTLRTVRQSRGMSGRALAKAAGVTQAAIQLIECGRRPNPTLKTMQKLAAALGVNLEELTGAS